MPNPDFTKFFAPATGGKSPCNPDSSGVKTPSLTEAEKALVDELVADGLAIQHKFRLEPLYKQTARGHYVVGTVDEIQEARAQPDQKGNQP